MLNLEASLQAIVSESKESLESKGIAISATPLKVFDLAWDAICEGIVKSIGEYFEDSNCHLNTGSRYDNYWVTNAICGDYFSYRYAHNLPNKQYFKGNGDDEQFILQNLDAIESLFLLTDFNEKYDLSEIIHAVIGTEINSLLSDAKLGSSYCNQVFSNNDAYELLTKLGAEPENYGIKYEEEVKSPKKAFER